jgi:hypothetical protein
MRPRARHSPSPCLLLAHEATFEAAQHRPISLSHQTAAAITVEGRSRTRIAPRSALKQEGAASETIRGKKNEDKGEAERVVEPPVARRLQDAVGRVISREAPPPLPPRRWCRRRPAGCRRLAPSNERRAPALIPAPPAPCLPTPASRPAGTHSYPPSRRTGRS